MGVLDMQKIVFTVEEFKQFLKKIQDKFCAGGDNGIIQLIENKKQAEEINFDFDVDDTEVGEVNYWYHCSRIKLWKVKFVKSND